VQYCNVNLRKDVNLVCVEFPEYLRKHEHTYADDPYGKTRHRRDVYEESCALWCNVARWKSADVSEGHVGRNQHEGGSSAAYFMLGLYASTVKMEAIYSSVTSVEFRQTVLLYISEPQTVTDVCDIASTRPVSATYVNFFDFNSFLVSCYSYQQPDTRCVSFVLAWTCKAFSQRLDITGVVSPWPGFLAWHELCNLLSRALQPSLGFEETEGVR
jgi:hypothetical protein